MVRRSNGLETSARNSTAILRDAGPSPSRIAPSKWLEMQEDEDTNSIINSIREDIVRAALKTASTNYLENKSYSFVVRCVHTAWSQLFNWMDLKCNAAVNSASIGERWTGDEEAATVPKDNWVCGNIEIRKMATQPVDGNVCEASCSQRDISDLLPRNVPLPPEQQPPKTSTEPTADKIVRNSRAEATPKPVIGESSDGDGNEETKARAVAPAVIEPEAGGSDRSEALSIFTRTIAMPRHKLPITRSSSVQNRSIVRGTDACREKSWRSWRLDAVEPPRKLSVYRLPANRLDIKCALMADSRSGSNGRVGMKKKMSSKMLSRESEGFKPRRESLNKSQL